MTDTPPEIGETISDDRPMAAHPCFDAGEKTAALHPDVVEDDAVATFSAVLHRFDDLFARMDRVETAINQVGSQTSWLVQSFNNAYESFTAMGEQLSKGGPAGLLKMIVGGGRQKNSGKAEIDER